MITVLIPGTSDTSGMTLVCDIKSLEHGTLEPVSSGAGAKSAVRCHTALMHMSSAMTWSHLNTCVRACRAIQNTNTGVETECCEAIPFNINRVKHPLTFRKEAAMNIVVTGRHFTITDEIRELTETKIEHALKVFPRVIRHTRIIIAHENLEYEVEANVELTAKKKILTSVAKDKDLRVALDMLNGKLNEQIRRLKERIGDKHRTIKTAPLNSAQ